MKRIVLPGYGVPHTFTLKEDATLGVLASGRLFEVTVKANEPTRIEFLSSMESVKTAA